MMDLLQAESKVPIFGLHIAYP